MNRPEPVANIFTRRLFRVPDYQRAYAWEWKQCQDLLDDLALLEPGKDHFAGTLVLCPSRDVPETRDDERNSYATFDLIDGQQRLTTLVMLLDAIRDQMEPSADSEGPRRGIERNYLAVRDRAGQPIPRLRLGAGNQDFFFNKVLGLGRSIAAAETVSQQRLLDAHRHFETYLAKQRAERGSEYADWLEALYVKVTEHLKMLVYEVESEADAGVIFETMNDRGKQMTEMDKVKNHLLYLATKLDLPDRHDLVGRINDAWSVIFRQLMAAGLLDGEDEDRLLRVHWLMAYDYQIEKWNKSRSIKDRFNLASHTGRHAVLLAELQRYVQTLRDAARVFADIYCPERAEAFSEFKPDPQLRRQIIAMSEKLRRMDQITPFLPLLIAVRLDGDPAAYLRAVTLCELFAFRVYNWKLRRSNVGQSRLTRLGYDYYHRTISPRTALDDLQVAAVEYCTDTDFAAIYDNGGNWYEWGALKYFLYEYEQHLADCQRRHVRLLWSDVHDDKKNNTIEHILPQHPDMQGYWAERFTPEQMERWKNDIGNLCLTQDNSWLSNRPFREKVGVQGDPRGVGYINSMVFQERALANYQDWEEASIIERREEIRAWAVRRWRVALPERVAKADENDLMVRVLTRIPVPEGQRLLFKALYEAGDEGLDGAALPKKMGRRPSQVTGIFGALGNRINQTIGKTEGKLVGIGLLLEMQWRNGEYRCWLRPEFRKVLESAEVAHLRLLA